jgi:hypothetical protein
MLYQFHPTSKCLCSSSVMDKLDLWRREGQFAEATPLMASLAPPLHWPVRHAQGCHVASALLPNSLWSTLPTLSAASCSDHGLGSSHCPSPPARTRYPYLGINVDQDDAKGVLAFGFPGIGYWRTRRAFESPKLSARPAHAPYVLAQLIKLQLPIDSPVLIPARWPVKHQIHKPKNTALHIPPAFVVLELQNCFPLS